jgi:hypothetical protein
VRYAEDQPWLPEEQDQEDWLPEEQDQEGEEVDEGGAMTAVKVLQEF